MAVLRALFNYAIREYREPDGAPRAGRAGARPARFTTPVIRCREGRIAPQLGFRALDLLIQP